MPCFNTERFVGPAVESILRQSYPHWELQIWDDGSTDGTARVLGAFRDARIRIRRHQVNQGYLRTCNELLAQCTGDLITFQDSDDLSDSDRLRKQVGAFAKDPDLGICGTWTKNVTEAGRDIRIVRKETSDDMIRATVSTRSPFCGATIMIRRHVYEEVGGYRPYFDGISYQDYDWSYRIVEQFKAANLPEPLYIRRHRRGANSK